MEPLYIYKYFEQTYNSLLHLEII